MDDHEEPYIPAIARDLPQLLSENELRLLAFFRKNRYVMAPRRTNKPRGRPKIERTPNPKRPRGRPQQTYYCGNTAQSINWIIDTLIKKAPKSERSSPHYFRPQVEKQVLIYLKKDHGRRLPQGEKALKRALQRDRKKATQIAK